VQHHVPFATPALPRIEPEKRVNLFLQITLPKYPEDPAAAAMLAVSPVFDSRSFNEPPRENSVYGPLLLHLLLLNDLPVAQEDSVISVS
jgi:hypothetical protein